MVRAALTISAPMAIFVSRSKLEAVVFMWVPEHVGIACNAYADAVATAYLGNNDTEDASKVVRDAVRTRPCMYTVRREAAKDTEKRTDGRMGTCVRARTSGCVSNIERRRDRDRTRQGWRDGCGAKWL